METFRKILEHARWTPAMLLAWTLGGGWFALAMISLLLAMGPGQ